MADDKQEAKKYPADYKADKTIPGGKYVHPEGGFKNAHGQRIDEKGKVLKGEAPVPTVDVPAPEGPPPAQ
jgi:hypothetical protein